MRTRVLQNPFSKSLALHLLLLMLLVSYILLASQNRKQDEAFSVSLLDKFNEKDAIISDKTREMAKKLASKHYSHLRSNQKTVSVSDLGMRLNTQQWTSHVLNEAQQNGDYINGLKEDEISPLNTKEVVFHSYFKRVHDQLYRAWEPILLKQAEKLNNEGRLNLTADGFVTKTLITISAKGEIVKVQLLQNSGVIELDSAALTALNEAGPYPNPPHGLIDNTGNAQLPWDFILRN